MDKLAVYNALQELAQQMVQGGRDGFGEGVADSLLDQARQIAQAGGLDPDRIEAWMGQAAGGRATTDVPGLGTPEAIARANMARGETADALGLTLEQMARDTGSTLKDGFLSEATIPKDYGFGDNSTLGQNLLKFGSLAASMYGLGTGLESFLGNGGAMFDAAGAGADMFGQGAQNLGNYGAASAGMLDPSLITAPVAPVSTGAPVYDPLADFNNLTPGTYADLGGTIAPAAGTGAGTIASAINKLLGTSLTDADVSTGVKVGTTAAGLLAGSGAAGGADPLPGADTSGLDAARARTRSSIASMFEGQDPRYQGIRDSVLGFQKSNLDRDREEAARKLKFSLLRTGNAGGSLQVDEGSKLNRTYDRGLLDATNLADQAAQSARSSDASTKLDLLGRVDSGLDQDAATASAAEQMRLAGDRATSQGLGTTLGNVFADAGLMFQTDAARRGMTDARKAFQSMFSTVPGSSGGSYTGITGRA